MEIAFFPVPDMKTEINSAPQASVADEFSFMLSSMLKTTQSGAPLETELVDTAFDTSVLADNVKGNPLEANPESTEAVEVEENGEAVVAEAPLNVLPNEFASLAAPTELPANASLTVPFNGYFEMSFSQKKQISVPSGVSLNSQPVQVRVVDSIAPQVAVAPQTGVAPQIAAMPQESVASQVAAAPQTSDLVTEGGNIKAGQKESSSEKASTTKSEKGRIELAKSLFQGPVSQDHFDIEIPAEEILKQTVIEPVAEPAIAASGVKTESSRENAAYSQAFEQEPVERSEFSGKVEKTSIDQVRAQQADMSGFAFQDSKGQTGGNDTNASSGQAVQETQAGKPESMLSNPSFEKIIDGPVKEFSASPARVAPLAAEVQEKVQAGIKVSVEQGGGEVKMKLNPESLGEVRIRINVASGVVKAEITVENIEVKRIIESDSAFLRDSLGAHGLTLDKCVVEVGRSFEAGTREKSGESFSGDEQRPMKDREHEKENRENSGWQHRHFRKNYARHEDGGVDFFI